MKKTEQQKIVDRIIRTLQPFSKKRRERILKAAILLLDETDDDLEEDWMDAPSDPPEDD